MSRTLFLYIFKDLVRIFLLASGALAGMMSFGALLRPLTEHGLDGSQVAQMLSFLMPAMTTYSLPIAALFATTMVYGRLSADNELTAVRAAGISHLSIAVPALVMGLLVALTSLLFLCFIVPTFTYRVEKVIYSNLARLVANQIERTHEIPFKNLTIYAEGAYVPRTDPNQPHTQMVVLEGPMIVQYIKELEAESIEVPHQFFMAKEAHILIHQNPANDTAEIEGTLIGGHSFSRQNAVIEGGIAQNSFGPVPIESQLEEETKFMDIRRLQELLQQPGKSNRLRGHVDELIANDQRLRYLRSVRSELAGPERTATFRSGTDQYILSILRPVTLTSDKGDLVITAKGDHLDAVSLTRVTPTGDRVLRTAREARVETTVAPGGSKLDVRVTLHEPMVTINNETFPIPNFSQPMSIPMPEDIQKLNSRTPADYLNNSKLSEKEMSRLRRDWYKVTNGIQSELHGRASFAVSCLILVVVGCALGMMFKSGNFLSAFAVSVVPALLCITLIATGQQTCDNIPWDVTGFDNATTLRLGLSLIWSGNFIVLAIAVALIWRLQRQ